MCYISRIEPRDHKVREGDFDDLLNFTFNGDNVENKAQRKRDLSLWNKYITDITPKDFSDIIQSWFYVDLDINVELAKDGLLRVDLRAPNDLFHESFFEADLNRQIFSKESTIRLLPVNDGKGLAQAWLGCQVELYAALGAKEMRHTATLMGGARKWAASGMYVDLQQTAPEKIASIVRDLSVKLEALREVDLIDAPSYKKLKPYIGLTAEDDLVNLVRHDVNLPSSDFSAGEMRITRDFVDALTRGYVANPLETDKDTAAQIAEKKVQHLVNLWNRVTPRQKPLPFSAFGLTQETYMAVIRYDDAKQMEYVGERLGGWKFGEVVKGAPAPRAQ